MQVRARGGEPTFREGGRSIITECALLVEFYWYECDKFNFEAALRNGISTKWLYSCSKEKQRKVRQRKSYNILGGYLMAWDCIVDW